MILLQETIQTIKTQIPSVDTLQLNEVESIGTVLRCTSDDFIDYAKIMDSELEEK